jgi:hypothetical protein
MPNAIEPIDAQINITKFNKSVIDPALVEFVEVGNLCFRMPGTSPWTAERY